MKLTYDEISPITNKKSVIVEYDDLNETHKLCMDSGYNNFSAWRLDNTDLISELESTLPQSVVDQRFVTPEGDIWYKIIISTPTMILYPDINTWTIVGLKDTDENQIPTFIWEGKQKSVDGSTAVIYDSFSEALDNFNLISTLYA